MSMEALDALVAHRVMDYPTWVHPPKHEPYSTDLDKAFAALEKAAHGRGWMVVRNSRKDMQRFVVGISGAPAEKGRDTLPMAASVCALLAVGVSPAEIEEAVRA